MRQLCRVKLSHLFSPNETVVPGQTVSRTDNAHFHAEITQHLCIIHPNVMVRNDDVQ